MASSLLSAASTILSFFFLAFSATVRASVPASAQFQYVNSGGFGPYIVEYDVNSGGFGPYIVEYDGNYRGLDPFAAPFQLFFYNTTPNAFTLAKRLSLRRWVWGANRGNSVRENATLTFGADGNLSLLSTGKMVLYDSKGKYLWQSFDYPTDTHLVGQSLKVGGVMKLVSRVSESVNADGPYSLVMEPKGLVLYYTSKNSPKPLLYFKGWSQPGPLSSVTFATEPVDNGFAYEMSLNLMVGNIGFLPNLFGPN